MIKQIDDNNHDSNPEILLVILVRSTNNRDSRINTQGNRVWLGNCRWSGNWQNRRLKRTNPQSYHHPNRCCQRDPLEVAESSIWWQTDGQFPTFGSKSRLGSQLCRRPSNNPTISSSRTEIGLRSKKTIPVLLLFNYLWFHKEWENPWDWGMIWKMATKRLRIGCERIITNWSLIVFLNLHTCSSHGIMRHCEDANFVEASNE